MRSRNIAWILGTALAFGVGCSEEKDKEAPPAPATPTIEELAADFCALAFGCCDRGEMNLYFAPWVTAENCVERIINVSTFEPGVSWSLEPLTGEAIGLQFRNLGALERATSEHRGTVNAAGVAECQAYLRSLDCNEPEREVEPDECVPPAPPPEPTPCHPDNLFIGEVGLGGVCSSPGTSFECIDGLVCVATEQYGVFGECVQPGGVGDPCFSWSDEECAKDLYCSNLYGTCQQFSQEGEECAHSDRESLSPDPATALIRCDPDQGLVCDTLTDTCVRVCERGAYCDYDEDCGTYCATDSCDADQEQELLCILGRCDLPRGERLPCGEEDDCEEDLVCNVDPNDPDMLRQICMQRLDEGEICSFHDECLSGFCQPSSGRCAPQVGDGDACASSEDAQCDNGRCVPEDPGNVCVDDADCPVTDFCDPVRSVCGWYCVGLLPNNADCSALADGDVACASGACVVGVCRELPLANGEPCESADQCVSEFCNVWEDEPECIELPLPLGARCGDSTQCDSGVCYDTALMGQPTCIRGQDEGEVCGPAQPPCNPNRFYCDTSEELPVCAVLRETGEECDPAIIASDPYLPDAWYYPQCRSRSCGVWAGRHLCDVAVPEDGAICDGGDVPRTVVPVEPAEERP